MHEIPSIIFIKTEIRYKGHTMTPSFRMIVIEVIVLCLKLLREIYWSTKKQESLMSLEGSSIKVTYCTTKVVS